MRKGTDLVRNAIKDFELARKYRQAKEYITASILYQKATEKVLKALYQHRTKRSAPTNASVEYLAEKMALPEGMYDDIVSMPDERTELMEEQDLLEYDEVESTRTAESIEHNRALAREGLVRRLIDYAEANV
ncbi:MAG: HEPN domain-containing protein [Candidatus Micrarchaeales archaeon]